MATRAFLSFVEEDLQVVNLFRGQAKADHTDLEFADYSVKIPYDSIDADYIKRQIAGRISLASLTVCLVGTTTYLSKWVDWELGKSKELGKPVMGVYLTDSSRILLNPTELYGCPLVDWNIADIVATMRRLSR